jgi:hypothetical protein
LARDGHLPVQARGLPGSEFDLANERLKSRRVDGDLVDAGFQIRNGIIP